MNNIAGQLTEIVVVINNLNEIHSDSSVPRNVREKVKNSIIVLEEKNVDIAIKINKSLQELDELSDDPNIPVYTRTQIWNVVTLLETIQNRNIYI